jgi:hypothetical protein
MTRLNVALRDIVEDLKVRWILAKARVRARNGLTVSPSQPASAERSSGETMIIEDRSERLRWAVRKAADVLEQLAAERVAFVIVMQPQAQGPCQTLSNVDKGLTINLLLHTAEGLMVGNAVDVGPARAN